jgi:hypothetical protein
MTDGDKVIATSINKNSRYLHLFYQKLLRWVIKL